MSGIAPLVDEYIRQVMLSYKVVATLAKPGLELKTTAYFEQKLLERPEIRREWCALVLQNPIKTMVQPNGRRSAWAIIPEYGDRVLRVIVLDDGETLHNAYFDRNFRSRLQRGLEP